MNYELKLLYQILQSTASKYADLAMSPVRTKTLQQGESTKRYPKKEDEEGEPTSLLEAPSASRPVSARDFQLAPASAGQKQLTRYFRFGQNWRPVVAPHK